jgi:biopolymer transport protein ExbD
MFPFLIMRFYVRKRRTTPAVIIVALIDVLIVLVIFLLVTTTFKQQQYMVKLAESSQAQKLGANDNPSLEVSIGKDGSLRFGPNAVPITAEQLTNKLHEAVAKNPDVTLEINADENAPWGKVVKVRDAAAEAKIKKLIANTKQTPKP